jgi:hypothetical protein
MRAYNFLAAGWAIVLPTEWAPRLVTQTTSTPVSMGSLERTESFNPAKIGSVLNNLLPLKWACRAGQTSPLSSLDRRRNFYIVEGVDEQQDPRETVDAGAIERALHEERSQPLLHGKLHLQDLPPTQKCLSALPSFASVQVTLHLADPSGSPASVASVRFAAHQNKALLRSVIASAGIRLGCTVTIPPKSQGHIKAATMARAVQKRNPQPAFLFGCHF